MQQLRSKNSPGILVSAAIPKSHPNSPWKRLQSKRYSIHFLAVRRRSVFLTALFMIASTQILSFSKSLRMQPLRQIQSGQQDFNGVDQNRLIAVNYVAVIVCARNAHFRRRGIDRDTSSSCLEHRATAGTPWKLWNAFGKARAIFSGGCSGGLSAASLRCLVRRTRVF